MLIVIVYKFVFLSKYVVDNIGIIYFECNSLFDVVLIDR